MLFCFQLYLEEPSEDIVDYLLAKGFFLFLLLLSSSFLLRLVLYYIADKRETAKNIPKSKSDSDRPHPFVIVGLHTCGDLGPLILRMFATDERVVGVVSVGCCYMKLSCDSHMAKGYPLSRYVSSLPRHSLSYECRELACHSKDVYLKRLEGETGK